MTKRLILQLRREKGTAYGLLSMSFFLRGKFNNSTMGLHTGYASMTSVQLVHPIIEGYLLWLPTLPAHTDIRKPNSVLSGLWFIISKEFCKEIFLCVHEYNPENYGLGYNCTIPSPLQNPCGAHTAHKALCMHYRVLLSASHKAPALWALMLLKSLTDVWHSELPSASPSSSPCCLCVPLGFSGCELHLLDMSIFLLKESCVIHLPSDPNSMGTDLLQPPFMSFLPDQNELGQK